MNEIPDIGISLSDIAGHDVDWRAFSLTQVEYPKGDNVGLILAVCSLLPISLIISFVTLILFRRDLHTIFFFIGILFCEALNLVLKNIIAQPRPHAKENLYTEYGMPSSHSQMSWFFAIYCILFIIFRLRHNHGCSVEVLWKSLVIFGLTISAFLVAYSRVYLLYHTWSQVICGVIIGVILGSVWFVITHVIFTPYFPTIASWKVCEFLMVRDTTLIPNILWFEYTNARSENRSRIRKLVSLKNQ